MLNLNPCQARRPNHSTPPPPRRAPTRPISLGQVLDRNKLPSNQPFDYGPKFATSFIFSRNTIYKILCRFLMELSRHECMTETIFQEVVRKELQNSPWDYTYPHNQKDKQTECFSIITKETHSILN